MIRAIIIDDEPGIVENLKDIINRNCKNVSIVAEAEDVESGINAIKKHRQAFLLAFL